jgi:hypothetical protein
MGRLSHSTMPTFRRRSADVGPNVGNAQCIKPSVVAFILPTLPTFQAVRPAPPARARTPAHTLGLAQTSATSAFLMQVHDS